jgi:hypothetical protein
MDWIAEGDQGNYRTVEDYVGQFYPRQPVSDDPESPWDE